MAYRCSWCGTLTETKPPISISHRHRTGVEYNPNADLTSSPICWDCTRRLAQNMRDFLDLLGPGMSGAVEIYSNTELARRMVLMIDILNSEPPGRDWGDTFP